MADSYNQKQTDSQREIRQNVQPSMFSYTEVRFWLVVIGVVASVVASWGTTNSKIDLLSEQVQQTNANISAQLIEQKSILDNLNQLNMRVTKIETLEGVHIQ
jgi:outer membrane murein-binding lipoprotein Lpp